jgi:hypothetical protein
MVELSGLRDIWVGVDHICRSKITLYYPNKRDALVITYELDKSLECEKDAKYLEDSLKEFKESHPILSECSQGLLR